MDRYRDAYGVEPVCRLLQIAPSGYRRRVQQRGGPWLRCKRSQSDVQHCSDTQRVWHANWQVYGAVKVWKQMHREGLPIARCTLQRLIRRLGLEGVRRGKKIRTTQPDSARPCPLDLVNRQFNAERPDQLWVTDFTYVSTWQGQMFVAFVIDVYARRIVGWRVSNHMRTDFVVDALEQELCPRQPQQEARLIHHSDRGTQYVSLCYSERLIEAGLMPSVGSTGDSYDNALAETINGLYKTEVIYKRGPWKTRESLELATLQWVLWFNHDRLLESIGHITLAEAEANYWRQVAKPVQADACTSTN